MDLWIAASTSILRERLIATEKAFARAIFCPFLRAHTFGNKLLSAGYAHLWFHATIPSWIGRSGKVMPSMVSAIRKRQVFNSVVGLVAILMVNQFCFQQCSPKVLAHNHPVFSNVSNITFLQSVWMLWHENVNVAIVGNESSATPPRVFTTATPVPFDVANVFAVPDAINSCLARNKFLTTSTATFDCVVVHVGIVLKTIEKEQCSA